MSLTLYDASVPYFIKGLQALQHILTKAEAFAKEKNIPESEFTTARLAPDMRPLTFQVQTASNTAKNSYVRISGKPGVAWDDDEVTFADLQARIKKTIDLLKEIKSEDLGGDPSAEITVTMGKTETTWTKQSYLQGFAVPNFYFHVVTAYSILRTKGVDIGKSDYLRPPTAN